MHAELGDGKSRGSIRVLASMKLNGVRVYDWNAEILENRVFLMRELLQRCEEEGFEVADDLPPEQDPFWDPVEDERLIGEAQILLEGLLMQMENQLDARILSAEGHQVGTLHIEVWPLNKEGNPGVPDDEIVDEPQELLGSRMGVQVKVTYARDLPEALANDVRIEYQWFIDQHPYRLNPSYGYNTNPKFDHKQVFVQDPVTSRFLEYLEKALVFRVYGRDLQAARIIDQLSPKVAAGASALALTTAMQASIPEEAEVVDVSPETDVRSPQYGRIASAETEYQGQPLSPNSSGFAPAAAESLGHQAPLAGYPPTHLAAAAAPGADYQPTGAATASQAEHEAAPADVGFGGDKKRNSRACSIQ